ncbi:group III truncated hemoglobin [uncultured Ferrovibrio sp.]|jgi:hemoglobin|uniref:group III truncated hemoglobin n=1 Tax=uncultured Ferrovibrio sp. TaxID=1576913 RepID=UPI002604A9F4|nr:group III truncated hemoglobin [uncultured Ferrovibrio sp.]
MDHDHDTPDSTYAERQARRAALAPGAAVGITEDMVRDVVHSFYGRIRADALLGPIFNRVIGDNWDQHLAKMCDFWSSVLLMTGRYEGRPMPAHIKIEVAPPANENQGFGPGLDAAHFDHWLTLFRQTVAERCPPEAAALFEDRAQRIAQSLLMGIRFSRGETPDWLGPAKSAPAAG